MVDTGKRRMKQKSVRRPSKTTKSYYRDTKQKSNCAISGKKLAGTHNTNKKSKSQKRPSVPFGGIVSGKEREKIFIELGKVVSGEKQLEDVEQKYRKFVEQAMKRVE
jgi:ribosomal protein L34E